MNDLRIPIGFFFSLIGIILLGVAVLSPGERAPLTTVNVNMDVGLVMVAFGGFMLLLAKKSR